MAKKSTELTAKEDDPHAAPAYLSGSEKVGLDGMGANDLVVPRIKLLQATSPELDTFDHAKRGHFWHNVMDELLGDTLRIVICRTAKRYTLLAPMGDPRGVLARARDGVHWDPPEGTFKVRPRKAPSDVEWTLAPTVEESKLHLFGTSIPSDPNSPPAAVMTYDYLVLLPDRPDLGVSVFSAARSQVRPAKRQLNSKIEMLANRNIPMQACQFRVGVIKEVGDEGDYFNYTFAMDGYAPEPLYNQARKVRDRFSDFQGTGDEFDTGDAPSAGGEAAETAADAKGI